VLTALAVNVLKCRKWDDKSVFDQEKDKSKFRVYETACNRVKAFYEEQHSQLFVIVLATANLIDCREANLYFQQ
jgi:hypothetical protein